MHNIDAKKRIENALQYAESSEYLQTKVNETSVDFILSQLHLQNKQPKGRRFTIANKIFALSLLKQSAKAYKIFRQVFAVPSRKTLLNLLHQIPFNCGINAPILKSLSKCVSKMDISSRQCSLIFDEMAIEPSLTYSKKDDEVIGFVSTGDGKKLIFADHVMVFMLRGITRKWKQPIAYFFTSGAMNSNDLKRNIEEIIKEVHAIGLRIVATVCDQHPVNVTAVNKLYEKTNSLYSRQSRENRNFGFEVDGKEVVPLFDPPHLLKGVRNNLLQNNASFAYKKQNQLASWTDIIALYKLDVGDYNTRMCYKLTDGHIFPEKMAKMKVNVAAQVFSHRVSTALRWAVKYGNF